MIPEDWRVSVLKDCCSKITDGTHDTPKPVQSGVPFLTAIHVRDNWIDFESCLYVTEADHDVIYRRCNPDNNDVLMVNIGAGVATTALVDVEYEFSLKNVALLKPDSRTVGAYLNYSLAHRKPKIIQDLSSGGAQPFLSLTHIGGIAIGLPPTKAEQEAIAEAISDAYALIESLEQLLTKKRQIKQGVMQELLTGKKRLPGFSAKWEVKRIGEFTDCTAGGTPSTLIPAYWNGSIRWMSSGELNLKFVNEVEGRITEDGLRNSSAQLVPVKSVLVGLAGQGKTRGTVAMNLVELCTNQSVAAIFPNPSFVPEYLYYNLDARYEELRGLSSGGAGRGGLNLTLIKSISVPLPCFDEQAAIAAILSDMDAEIAALEAKLTKARRLKQGMMQELLTGRIRLV